MPMKARYTVVNGEVIAQKRDGVRTELVPDMLGSTVAIVNMAQEKTDTLYYYPYGKIASRSGTTVTPFQFVGTLGYYQDAPDRSYVRARYLDSNAGRWITQDPIGFAGGLNLFRYVSNSPTMHADPLGLDETLVVYGSDQGPDVSMYKCVFWAQYGPFNSLFGNKLLTKPSKAQLIQALLDPQVTEFVFWGHGGFDGLDLYDYDAKHPKAGRLANVLTPSDVRDIATRRDQLHLPKLREVHLAGCYSVNTSAKVNAWLQMSYWVFGYPDVTGIGSFSNDFPYIPHISEIWYFTSPISYDPFDRAGANGWGGTVPPGSH